MCMAHLGERLLRGGDNRAHTSAAWQRVPQERRAPNTKVPGASSTRWYAHPHPRIQRLVA
jgi:hypothetical protein